MHGNTRRFSYLIIVAGAAVAAFSLYRLQTSWLVNLQLGLIALALIAIHLTFKHIDIPSGQFEYVTCEDVLLFVVLLVYDGEAAVLVAMIDGFFIHTGNCAACPPELHDHTRWERFIRRSFNASICGLDYFVPIWVLRLTFGPLPEVFAQINTPLAITALGLAALAAFLVNTLIVAKHQSLRFGKSLWDSWFTSSFKWAWITYVAGAAAAGLAVHFTRGSGMYALILVLPLIIIISLTYKTYVKNIETLAQAARAEAAREAALEAARLRSEFLANVSHEIRTPMNAVVGMTGLLLDSEQTAEQREFTEVIRSSGESLLGLVNDILDFSKIEAEKLELERQQFSLRDCVEEALDLFALEVAEKGLNLAYFMEECAPEEVVGDVTRLRQVLVNLVGNAVKFTPAGEVAVSVSAGPADEGGCELRFDVRDTGIGIPADRMGRLFNSFSQVDSSTTRHYGGTGLGLVISKRLVELMGGRMWVESTAGAGSTFSFTVRMEIGAAPAGLEAPHRLLAGKRALIVVANDVQRLALTRQSEKWGMAVRPVAAAQEALAHLGAERFDVVVIDAEMFANGARAFASDIAARQQGRGLPLVILTPVGKDARPARADGGGATSYLTKPVKLSNFYDALAGTINGRDAEQRRDGRARLDRRLAERLPLRILVADDNVINQKVALRILSRMGYRADVAADGREVIEAVRRQPYDLVLMDVQMPEMDGLEAARTLHREPAAWPVPRIVAMTASAMRGDRERCLEAGMDDFINKPVRPEEIQAALVRLGEKVFTARAGAPHQDAAPHGAEAAHGEPAFGINLSLLQELRDMQGEGESEDIVGELVRLYLRDTPPRVGHMLRAAASDDMPELRRLAHAVRGSCANMGLTRMSRLCGELEDAASGGEAAEAKRLLAQLEGEFERTREVLSVYAERENGGAG